MRVLQYLFFIGILVALWQLSTVIFHLPIYLLPSPLAVGKSLWENPHLLLQGMWPTLLEAFTGLILAIFTGSLIALCMVCLPKLRQALWPLLLVSQALPTFAIAPLLIIWFGYGLKSKVVITWLALFFPITLAFFQGLLRTPPSALDLAKLMGANTFRKLVYIQIPYALPNLADGIRIAAAWAVTAALVGEWVGASQGLGFIMIMANSRMDTPLLFAVLMVLVAMSLGLYGTVNVGLKKWLSSYLKTGEKIA